jgi:hypothetical protein
MAATSSTLSTQPPPSAAPTPALPPTSTPTDGVEGQPSSRKSIPLPKGPPPLPTDEGELSSSLSTTTTTTATTATMRGEGEGASPTLPATLSAAAGGGVIATNLDLHRAVFDGDMERLKAALLAGSNSFTTLTTFNPPLNICTVIRSMQLGWVRRC